MTDWETNGKIRKPAERAALAATLEALPLESRRDALEVFRAEHLREAGLTPKQAAYLVALARCGRKFKAMEAVPVNYISVRRWREQPVFKELETLAIDLWVEALEERVDARAFEGVLEPVIGRVGKDQDGIITHVRRYSDQLALARLRALAPERYAERRKTELSGPDGGPIQLQPVVNRLRDKLLQRAQRMKELINAQALEDSQVPVGERRHDQGAVGGGQEAS